MTYRIRTSIYDFDGGLINEGDWSSWPGDVSSAVATLERRGFELKETETGYVLVDTKSIRTASRMADEVLQITEFEPVENRGAMIIPMVVDDLFSEPVGGYFSPETEARRARFYELADMIFPLSDEEVRETRARIDSIAARLSGGARLIGVAGRDGKRQFLNGRARVNEDPREPDKWSLFDSSHPIEQMRMRGSLGKDRHQTVRRYQAAQVWQRMLYRAEGVESLGDWLSERVDGTTDPQGRMVRRAEAVTERALVAKAPGVTKTRRADLDSVVGRGESMNARAKATGRHHSTVRDSILAGLDAVANFRRWENRLRNIQVLYVEPIPKKSRGEVKKTR